VNRYCLCIAVQLANLVWILPLPLVSQSSGVRSTQATAHGRQTFAQYCSSCHSVHHSTSLAGPSLKSYYSTHEPRLADASVRDVISNGKGKMPAFHNLSAIQINELIAYLKTFDETVRFWLLLSCRTVCHPAGSFAIAVGDTSSGTGVG